MSAARHVTVLNVHPVHPGRGEASYIEIVVALDYLKGVPIAVDVLYPESALVLIEQLARAIRSTTMLNEQ
jgi:hypothetical protein